MRHLTLRTGSAAIATSLAMLVSAPTAAETFRLEEATLAEIQAAMDAGALTSEQLVQMYLDRIEAYDDQGPSINALITVNLV